jgi:riboflavin synthase
LRLVISAALFAQGVDPKDSVAVDGVCLTATALAKGHADFDVVPETLARSTLGALAAGARVNLELALRYGDRVGGHLVYGHVDASAAILAKQTEGQGYRLTVEAPRGYAKYLAEKGFVALDGVSLTVAAVREDRFEIALIPETAQRTTLGFKGRGDRVNFEIDPLARYALGGANGYSGAVASAELDWAYEI